MANKTSQKIEASKIVARHAAAGSVKPVSAAAVELRMPRGTLGRWMHDLRKAGLIGGDYVAEVHQLAAEGEMGFDPVLPGYRISQTTTQYDGDGEVMSKSIQQKPANHAPFQMPEGHVIKGISTLVDRDGNTVLEWRKTKAGDRDPAAIAETLKNAFRDVEGRALPKPSIIQPRRHLVNFLPCNDWHVGMYSWARETGTNWDLRMAEDAIGQGVVDTIYGMPTAPTSIILGGGDLVHSDNNSNETAKSRNKLDVDGRHQKVVETAGRLIVLGIDTALERSERVIFRNLKGNHDEETSSAIGWFIHAWYRNEPRVTVDLDESLFWFWDQGKVMLAGTHGHEVKPQAMPGIMAHRQPEMWGRTRYRYAYTFHVHHSSKYATEGQGVISESHQAPIPQDAWHYGAGFLSGRSLQGISYDDRFGEIGRVRTAMMDAEKEAA